MPKKKVSNPQSTEPKEEKQKVRLLEEWFNFKLYARDILTTTTMERLAKELEEWARTNEEAIQIKKWVGDKGIGISTWGRWITQYDCLKEAHAQALMHIGARRERGAIEKKFDAGVINFMQPMYDKDYDNMLERRAVLKNKTDDDKGGTKIVIMEKFASDPSVPHKRAE